MQDERVPLCTTGIIHWDTKSYPRRHFIMLLSLSYLAAQAQDIVKHIDRLENTFNSEAISNTLMKCQSYRLSTYSVDLWVYQYTSLWALCQTAAADLYNQRAITLFLKVLLMIKLDQNLGVKVIDSKVVTFVSKLCLLVLTSSCGQRTNNKLMPDTQWLLKAHYICGSTKLHLVKCADFNFQNYHIILNHR